MGVVAFLSQTIFKSVFQQGHAFLPQVGHLISLAPNSISRRVSIGSTPLLPYLLSPNFHELSCPFCLSSSKKSTLFPCALFNNIGIATFARKYVA